MNYFLRPICSNFPFQFLSLFYFRKVESFPMDWLKRARLIIATLDGLEGAAR